MRVSSCLLLVSAAVVLCHAPYVLASDVETVVALGYDRGGDELLRVVFTDGSRHVVHANQGASIKVGAMFYHTEDLTWQTQATVGAQYNHIQAKNGSAEWINYPIEAIGFYNANLIRVGLGAVYQIHPHVRTSGVISSYGANLNNAMGWVAQLGFRPKKMQGMSVDVRYTSIKYSGDAVYAGVPQRLNGLDGSNVGLYFTFIF